MQVQVGDEKLEINITAFVEIYKNQIDLMFAEQPGKVVYIGEQMIRAKRNVEIAKMKLEATTAETYLHIRSQFDAAGEKFTESKLDKLVVVDKEIRIAKKRIVECTYAYDALKMITSALEHRRDMLIQLGAHIRSEASEYALRVKKNVP